MENGELLYDDTTMEKKIEKRLENFKDNFNLRHDDYREKLFDQAAHLAMYDSQKTIYLFYEVNWRKVREVAAYDDKRMKLFQISNNLITR